MTPGKPIQADSRSPIDAAIDEVEQRQLEEQLAVLEDRDVGRVPLLNAVHRWNDSSEVVVDAMPDDHPTLLMWDATQGAFRVVILPAGTKWRIIPDRPALWTPGGPA